MFGRSEKSDFADERPQPPSRAPFFTLIAKQNQNSLFPLLIDSDPRVKTSLTSSSLYYHTNPLPRLPPPEDRSKVIDKTKVQVVPIDSFDCAENLTLEKKADVVVLNMANAFVPGGDYFGGSGAQEEALCRRSTLYLSIGPQRDFHPIPAHGAIYSPDVLVVRKSDEEECQLLRPEERWWTTVISIAAISRPPLNDSRDDFLRERDREETRNRIRTLFRVAAMEGRKNLVLSALGCGSFRNPPRPVACLFKDVLRELEFRGRFEGVWFSVIDRKESENYKVFKTILDGMEI